VGTAIHTAGRSILAFHGLITSPHADLFWSFEFRIILVGWVYFDRRVREFGVPFEFEAFIFFAWILLLPYYLYRTRRLRGLLLLGGHLRVGSDPGPGNVDCVRFIETWIHAIKRPAR
jgi:hypothetical protein